ncbi:MAG: hypothetical protein OXU45_00195 [Candidatus Melainabacteria bacterium]|nr:hypothetical protein [Candidatus Melainabacteria bacterium]
MLETKFDTETWKDDEKMNLSFVGSIDSSKEGCPCPVLTRLINYK